MRGKRSLYGGLVIATTALVVGVWGTGRDGATPSVSGRPVLTPLSGTPSNGTRTVILHDLDAGALAGLHRRPDLPGNEDLLPANDGMTGGNSSIPEFGTGNMTGGANPGGRTAAQRGILAGLNEGLDGGPSWGWLADEVNAAVPPAANQADDRFVARPPTDVRQQPQGSDRLGTGLDSTENTFRFQRRQGDR
jgi:hypothetical protein